MPTKNVINVADDEGAARCWEPTGGVEDMLDTLAKEGTYTNHRPMEAAEHSDFTGAVEVRRQKARSEGRRQKADVVKDRKGFLPS
jgi:hypothetical protein